jgi:diaminohydroxyphosphoribosylaminopyrimidine deaminase/5-amino-6-(5-phosphoribosylamino)uracil reductase
MSLTDAAWAGILAAHLNGDPASTLPGPFSPLLGGAFTIAQIGQSLDGRVATESGHSHYINGAPALRHLHALRALSDAVLVGVGTVLADDPLLTVRRVTGPNPARVVIDPRGRVPIDARCFQEDGVRRLVLRSVDAPTAPGVEVLRLQAGADGRLDPHMIVSALHAAGLYRLLVEGGPATISAFLAADALDRLHVLTAPVLIGSGFPGLTLPSIATMAQALRPEVHPHLMGDGEVLFDCNMRSTR